MIRPAIRLLSPIFLVSALLFGGIGAGAATHSPTVKVRMLPSYGRVLVTPSGMTLYYYKVDSKTKSNCTGSCAAAWPPLMLKSGMTKPIKPHGLKGKLSSIKRGSGRQVTYRGHPLYTYAADSAPGQVKGNGVGGVWFVMKAK